MVMLYLLGAVMIPVAVHTLLAVKELPRSRRCPKCGRETLRLRSRACAAASRLRRGVEYHRRWCMECGWGGVARVRTRCDTQEELCPATAGRLTSMSLADPCGVRCVEVNGLRWQVVVQVWPEKGEWLGRLMFVGPQQCAWVEGDWSLRGASALEVLSRGLTLPDRALVQRLRTLVR